MIRALKCCNIWCGITVPRYFGDPGSVDSRPRERPGVVGGGRFEKHRWTTARTDHRSLSCKSGSSACGMSMQWKPGARPTMKRQQKARGRTDLVHDAVEWPTVHVRISLYNRIDVATPGLMMDRACACRSAPSHHGRNLIERPSGKEDPPFSINSIAMGWNENGLAI